MFGCPGYSTTSPVRLIDFTVVRVLSRRSLFHIFAGACGGLLVARGRTDAKAAIKPGHEDLIDEGPDFDGGVFEGCAREGQWLVAFAPGARFTSRVLEAREPFRHIGLHWDVSPSDAGLSFAVRLRDSYSAWSDWRSVGIERLAGECPAKEIFGRLLFAGDEARAVQYRVDFDGLPRASLCRVAASVLFQNAWFRSSDRDAQAPQPPVRRMNRAVLPGLASDVLLEAGDATHAADSWHGRVLEVVPREAWGANESLRFDENGQELWHEMFVPVRALMVHHTGTRNSYESREEAVEDVRSMYYYHAVIQGWHDFGYNAVIDRFGNIYEGRHGRGGDAGDAALREVLSEGVSGGHVHKHNYGSAGVALLGDSSEDGWPMLAPEGPMWEALVRYCAFEAGRAGLRPVDPVNHLLAATSTLLRSDDLWHDEIPNFGGHRDSEQTICPGDVVLDLLPDLRAAVYDSLTGLSRSGVSLERVSAPNREVTPGTRLSYRWSAERPEAGRALIGFQYALEGWFKPDGEDDLTYLHGYTNDRQPRLAWTTVAPSETEAQFIPVLPGQYTMHVRALVDGPRGPLPAAFEGRDTVLVGGLGAYQSITSATEPTR